MRLEEYLLEIQNFIEKYLDDSKANGYVLGLSGGVDSSLVAALTKKAVGSSRLTCLILPIESDEKDTSDALAVGKSLNVIYEIMDATEAYRSMKKVLEEQGVVLDRPALSNLKVRIRMSILYAFAQQRNLLVLGTDNKDERYTGYFTKWGDGACDLLPIVHLTKGEVIKASKLLGIPEKLAERIPSAGLFEGQTDEKEMGVTYKDLDAYLLGEKIDDNVAAKIEKLHKNSEHKRNPIPCPKDFNRD